MTNPTTENQPPPAAGGGRQDLSRYSAGGFSRGAGRLKEGLWLVVRLLLFELCPLSCSALKAVVLRLFGARIGRGVVIKPRVKITFPWKLKVGNYVWLGEECWLLNLERIELGDNVCISQRAFLCTGSHNFARPSFDLIVRPIQIESEAWLGAGCWLGPGVRVGRGAVLTAGSVASHDLRANAIYRGHPAVFVKERWPSDRPPAGQGKAGSEAC